MKKSIKQKINDVTEGVELVIPMIIITSCDSSYSGFTACIALISA